MNKRLLILGVLLLPAFIVQDVSASRINKGKNLNVQVVMGTTLSNRREFEDRFNKSWEKATYEEQEKFLESYNRRTTKKKRDSRALRNVRKKRRSATRSEKSVSRRKVGLGDLFKRSSDGRRRRFAGSLFGGNFFRNKDRFSAPFLDKRLSIKKGSSLSRSHFVNRPSRRNFLSSRRDFSGGSNRFSGSSSNRFSRARRRHF